MAGTVECWPPSADFVEFAKETIALMNRYGAYFTDDEYPNLAFGYHRDCFFIMHRDEGGLFIVAEAPLKVAHQVYKKTLGVFRPDLTPSSVRLYGLVREPGILYSLEVDGFSLHLGPKEVFL